MKSQAEALRHQLEETQQKQLLAVASAREKLEVKLAPKEREVQDAKADVDALTKEIAATQNSTVASREELEANLADSRALYADLYQMRANITVAQTIIADVLQDSASATSMDAFAAIPELRVLSDLAAEDARQAAAGGGLDARPMFLQLSQTSGGDEDASQTNEKEEEEEHADEEIEADEDAKDTNANGGEKEDASSAQQAAEEPAEASASAASEASERVGADSKITLLRSMAAGLASLEKLRQAGEAALQESFEAEMESRNKTKAKLVDEKAQLVATLKDKTAISTKLNAAVKKVKEGNRLSRKHVASLRLFAQRLGARPMPELALLSMGI